MDDRLTRRCVLLFVSFMLLFYGAMIFLPDWAGPVSNAGSILGDALSMAIMAAGLRRWPESRRLAWKLFLAGIAVYMVGDMVWVYEEEVLGLEVESPSIPDFFYLSSTLVCFFALLRYIHDEKTIDIATAGFDILISIVASAGLLYNYVMLPVSSFKEMGFWQAVVMMAYPVADCVYLLGMFSLIFGMGRRRARNGRNFLLGAGLFLMFLADQTYLVKSITEYVSGGLLDPVWSMSFGLIALASLRVPDWEEMAEEDTETAPWLEYLRMLLPYLLTVLILLLVGMEYGLIGSPFFVGALLLMMLLSVRQVIVLIPEIALSWQTVRRFRNRFGEQVTVMNSRMSKGERYEQFERMRRGEASVVIGPRSALFAPFASLGLIVIDEEQEPSFRSETMPRYDSREAALFRAEEEGAHVLFGSATPSVDSYYRACTGRYALVKLKGRYGDAELPDVQIVDMREEQKAGNFTLISGPLEEAVRRRLK